MKMFTRIRGVVAIAGATGALLVSAVLPASAGQSFRDNNCLHPVTGVNLNELFGVPEQLVYACGGPTAGEHWRPFAGYFGAEASDAVYPPGYVPLHASPVDDILAKLSIKVVIDGGTSQEKTYTFFPSDTDAFHTDLTLHDVNPVMFPDLPGFIVIPRMAPLSVGHHTSQIIWVQSASHCDGTSTDAESCLPSGEHPLSLRPFDVSIPQPAVGS